MTLHRERGNIIAFECDGCDEALDTGTADFNEAREELKAERWQTRNGGGDVWLHYCPSCKLGKRGMDD